MYSTCMYALTEGWRIVKCAEVGHPPFIKLVTQSNIATAIVMETNSVVQVALYAWERIKEDEDTSMSVGVLASHQGETGNEECMLLQLVRNAGQLVSHPSV